MVHSIGQCLPFASLPRGCEFGPGTVSGSSRGLPREASASRGGGAGGVANDVLGGGGLPLGVHALGELGLHLGEGALPGGLLLLVEDLGQEGGRRGHGARADVPGVVLLDGGVVALGAEACDDDRFGFLGADEGDAEGWDTVLLAHGFEGLLCGLVVLVVLGVGGVTRQGKEDQESAQDGGGETGGRRRGLENPDLIATRGLLA